MISVERFTHGKCRTCTRFGTKAWVPRLSFPCFALLSLAALPTSTAPHQSKMGARLGKKIRIRIFIYGVFCVSSSRSEWVNTPRNRTSVLRVNSARKSLNFNGQKAPEHINMNKNCTGTYDFPSRCVTSPMDDNQAVFKSKRGAPNFSAWDFRVARDRIGFAIEKQLFTPCQIPTKDMSVLRSTW